MCIVSTSIVYVSVQRSSMFVYKFSRPDLQSDLTKHVAMVVVLPMLAALAAAGANMNHSTSSLVDWWAGAVEEDAIRSLPLDGEGGLWASAFVPPPPRPEFLDDHATPDGLTTCDLCSWAWHDRGGIFSLDSSHDSSGELGWMLTLAIVSILSAAIGAVVMVTVLQCRKSPSPAAAPAAPQERAPNADGNKDITAPRAAFADGDANLGSGPTTAAAGNSSTGGRGRVWTWLTSRRSAAGPPQLCSAPGSTVPAENHYTLDEVYGEEALYAELDRELSPAYQNTAYTGSDGDPDAPPSSSAPSSAYYSDLSCATGPDRTYEAVGLALGTTTWEGGDRRRLAAITETLTVPSDYV